MRFIYDLTNKNTVNGISEPEIEKLVSSTVADFDFIDYCVIAGSDITDRGRVFYSIIVKRSEKGDTFASVNAIYGERRECALESLGTGFFAGDFELSSSALRATLKRMYSGASAYITASADVVENCGGIVAELYRYADLSRLSEYRICINALPAYSFETKVVAVVAQDSAGIPDTAYPYDLEHSNDKGSTLDALCDHLIACEGGERIQLLDLLDKYSKYTEEDAESVYKAFVEGDEELIFELVHDYCTDAYSRSESILIEAGVKSVIRQNLRDRLVLKLIYEGYDTMPFAEMLAKNRAEIAFCSAFRSVDDLFSGDNAESYNIVLASHVTSGVEENESLYQAVKEENALVDALLNTSENPIEYAMISAYIRVLGTLMKRAEEITQMGDDVLAKVGAYLALCDADALYSEATDDAIASICRESGSDHLTLQDKIEALRHARYSEILVHKAEAVCNSENDPSSTLREIEKALQITKDIDSDNADAENGNSNEKAELYSKLDIISQMNGDNYIEVYRQLFGSEYINDLLGVDEEDNEDNEKYLDYFVAKMGTVFARYSDFIGEINAYESISENSALKLLIKEKYSDMLYCALANSDAESFADVVAGYDVERVDDRVFFPMLFAKASALASESQSVEHIDKALEKTDNDIIVGLLLAAKFASGIEIPTQYFYIDLEELVNKFSVIEKYVNGDILFNATVSGVKYSALSLRLYIDARQGQNTEKVRRAAENSPQLNNFFAAMMVEGFEHIDTEVKVVEVVKEVVREVIKEVPSAPFEDVDAPVTDTAESPDTVRVETDDTDVVVLDKKAKRKKKRKDETFDAPESFSVIIKKDNTEKMKTQMIVLGSLTAAALAILIYFFLK